MQRYPGSEPGNPVGMCLLLLVIIAAAFLITWDTDWLWMAGIVIGFGVYEFITEARYDG